MRKHNFSILFVLLTAIFLLSCAKQESEFELIGTWKDVNSNTVMEFTNDNNILINGKLSWNYNLTTQNNTLVLKAVSNYSETITTISYNLNQNNLIWGVNSKTSKIYKRKKDLPVKEIMKTDYIQYINAEPQRVFTTDINEITIAPKSVFVITLPLSPSKNIFWQYQTAETITETGNGIQRTKEQDLHHFGFQVNEPGQYQLQFSLTDGESIYKNIYYKIVANSSVISSQIKGKIRSAKNNQITLISNGETYDFVITSESIIELINIGETAFIYYQQNLETNTKYIIQMNKK